MDKNDEFLTSRTVYIADAKLLSTSEGSMFLKREKGINDNLRFFCQICLGRQAISEGYTLNCGHTYCSECLVRYLEVKLRDGMIQPKCFHPLGQNNQHVRDSKNSSSIERGKNDENDDEFFPLQSQFCQVIKISNLSVKTFDNGAASKNMKKSFKFDFAAIGNPLDENILVKEDSTAIKIKIEKKVFDKSLHDIIPVPDEPFNSHQIESSPEFASDFNASSSSRGFLSTESKTVMANMEIDVVERNFERTTSMNSEREIYVIGNINCKNESENESKTENDDGCVNKINNDKNDNNDDNDNNYDDNDKIIGNNKNDYNYAHDNNNNNDNNNSINNIGRNNKKYVSNADNNGSDNRKNKCDDDNDDDNDTNSYISGNKNSNSSNYNNDNDSNHDDNDKNENNDYDNSNDNKDNNNNNDDDNNNDNNNISDNNIGNNNDNSDDDCNKNKNGNSNNNDHNNSNNYNNDINSSNSNNDNKYDNDNNNNNNNNNNDNNNNNNNNNNDNNNNNNNNNDSYINSKDNHDDTNSTNNNTLSSDASILVCDAIISTQEISHIISNSPELIKKFKFFKFTKENINGRECSVCNHLQICSPLTPLTVCGNCGDTYCFFHSKAHPDMSCEEVLIFFFTPFLYSFSILIS